MLNFIKNYWKVWAFLLGLIICTMISFYPALKSEYQLDDAVFVGGFADSDASYSETIKKYPTRWLAALTFKLQNDFDFFELADLHIVNLTIHILNIIIIFLLAKILICIANKKSIKEFNNSDFFIAALVTSLFAIHPLQSQAVIYISQRVTLLVTFFYLTAILSWCYGYYYSKKKYFWYALTFLLGFLGIFCKEVICALPITLLIIFIFNKKNTIKFDRKKIISLILATIIIITIPIVIFAHLNHWDLNAIKISLNGVGGNVAAHNSGMGNLDYTFTQTYVVVKYLKLFFIPFNLCIDHQVSPYSTDLIISHLIIPTCILLAITIFVFIYRKKMPLLILGWLWWLFALAPQSSFIPSPDLIFEHRTYHAFFGIAIIVSAILVEFLKYFNTKVKYIIVAILILFCTITTYSRSKVWQTPLSLWNSAYELYPQKERVILNYANALVESEHPKRAYAVIEKALNEKIYISPHVYRALGNIFFSFEDYQNAIDMYEKYMKLNCPPDEDYQNVIDMYKKYMEENNTPDVVYSCAQAYYELDKKDEALEILNEIEINAAWYANTYYMRGMLMLEDDEEQALSDFETYLKLAPYGDFAIFAMSNTNTLTKNKK